MNADLFLMLGVALLLVAGVFKGALGTLVKWASLGCAALLAIQPIAAALRWVGGLFGV